MFLLSQFLGLIPNLFSCIVRLAIDNLLLATMHYTAFTKYTIPVYRPYFPIFPPNLNVTILLRRFSCVYVARVLCQYDPAPRRYQRRGEELVLAYRFRQARLSKNIDKGIQQQYT